MSNSNSLSITLSSTPDRDLDRSLLNSLSNTSKKVRYLSSLGFSRTEVSHILNIRYQHVRNILITPVKNG